MKKINLLFYILISFASVALAATSFTFAWLSGATTEVNMNRVGGGVISQYFHCGDGSENDPFVITRPVHLYNMTELYENLEGFAEEDYHFQLGYDLENNGTLEVYDYDDDGKIIEDSYGTSLNMNYYTNFRPVGSADTPFDDIFDGSSLTIENIHINESGKSDIGFFGYVTEDAHIQDLYLDNLDIDVSGTAEDNHDHDEAPQNSDNSYVGFIAGHIDDATCFENTYVNNCSITGENDHIQNDWGYFGYCKNAASLQEFITHAGQGEEDAWGGSFHSKTYTNLLYNLNHSTTAETTSTFSGQGGYVIKKTASATTDPNNSQVVYRLRDGSYAPLKFASDTHTQAALGNTGYLVGSNVGTGANASPKISSYKMVNLQNALTNTRSTNMADTYKAANIAYTDSKLEIMTYQNGWKRIKDSHNANNNSTNAAITSYTKTDLANFNFVKYTDSRDALQEVLESSPFVHGIHFDNNAISTSSLLTVPANTARINGKNITTSYQLPKGAVDFNLKEEGFINFFAGTYNSSQVNLNFFSLYKVTRNDSGNITALTQIKKIYHASSGEGYIYQTGNSKPSGAGDLAFDVETILHGNAPVINMMYYFEIPVNAGEYAMGVAGSTQGAYMIYLDLGANAGEGSGLIDDFTSIEYRSSPETTEHSILLLSYSYATNVDFTLNVIYDNKKYYITAHSNSNITLKATILNINTEDAYEYYINSNTAIQNPEIKTYNYIV